MRLPVIRFFSAFLGIMLLCSGCFSDGHKINQSYVDTLLNSVINNDLEAFTANATDVFKASITDESLRVVSAQVAPRYSGAKSLKFLGVLDRGVFDVFLWKIEIDDEQGDFLVKVVINEEGQLSGFWIE